MLPYFSTAQKANEGMGNSILFSQLRTFFSFFKSFKDLFSGIFRQLGVFVFGANKNGFMYFSVFRIRKPSVISNVAQMVVCRVSIVMATLHSIGARPNKSKHYKLMDSEIFNLPMLCKPDLFPAKRSIALGYDFSSGKDIERAIFCWRHSVKAFDFSSVRDFIKAIITGYGFPDFFHVVAPSNAPNVKFMAASGATGFREQT